jgi:uncharacterized membrane protein
VKGIIVSRFAAKETSDFMENKKAYTGWKWEKIFQYFLQGLLVIAPVTITIYLIYWFISSVDSWLPIFTVKDEYGNIVNRNYGLGFVVIIIALIVIGYLSSNFITSRIFSLFDRWLEHTPGVKYIYSSVKDFFEAFAGNKRKFQKAVLVSIQNNDVWQIGFITDDNASEFGLQEFVTVYVPLSYSLAGITYLVPKTRVRQIDHISPGDALKYTVSGGITAIDEEAAKLKTGV